MKNSRISELDGLRGIAAMAVAMFHYLYHYNHKYGHEFEVFSWTQFGFYGVHLFFLISGFVIFWTISKVKRPFDFIWSRFSRLYPVFWVAVSITFIAVSLFGLADREVNITTLAANYSMIHEYFGFKHVDGVYWSLTLELTFYFWMFLLLIFNQVHHIEKWLLGWTLGAAVITSGKLGLELPQTIKFFFLLEYIELFTAGICFYLIKENRAKFLTYLTLGASIAALFIQHPLYIALLLCLIYLIFYCAISGRLSLLSYKPLVFLGTISYSFYLVHQNIGYIIINKFYLYEQSPVVGILVALSVALILATLLTFTIEKPAMEYLRTYYKSNERIQYFANKWTFFNSRS